MKKIDIITNCLECSWLVRGICGRTQRKIVLDKPGFPDWCTLSDASEIGNASTYCASCGKPLGRVCDKCQRLWES